jgi:branched-chain amino acid transport system substrate-binding protein
MKTLAQKILILGAFTALFTVSADAEDRPIVLGIPVGLSGANSITAPSVIQAMDLAISEINDAGGAVGQKVSP